MLRVPQQAWSASSGGQMALHKTRSNDLPLMVLKLSACLLVSLSVYWGLPTVNHQSLSLSHVNTPTQPWPLKPGPDPMCRYPWSWIKLIKPFLDSLGMKEKPLDEDIQAGFREQTNMFRHKSRYKQVYEYVHKSKACMPTSTTAAHTHTICACGRNTHFWMRPSKPTTTLSELQSVQYLHTQWTEPFPHPIFPPVPWGPRNDSIVVFALSPISSHPLSLFFFFFLYYTQLCSPHSLDKPVFSLWTKGQLCGAGDPRRPLLIIVTVHEAGAL